jgi:hypothetical protein
MTKARITLYVALALLGLSAALVIAHEVRGLVGSVFKSPAEKTIQRALEERPVFLKRMDELEKKAAEAEGAARAAETRALAAEASAKIYMERWQRGERDSVRIKEERKAMKPVADLTAADAELTRRGR